MTDERPSGAITVENHPNYLAVRLGRPEVRNAIDQHTVDELHELCESVERRPRPVVFQGDGRAFASGADLREMIDRDRFAALRGINSRLFDRVAGLPLPTVAVVNGVAYGAGAELAYACDLRIATPAARFGNPEVKLGILPAAGACKRLKELVGLPRAREMLFTGRSLDAREALLAGLVMDVVPDEAAPGVLEEVMHQICRGDELALRITKLSLSMPQRGHTEFDNVAQALLFESPAKRERMEAFLRKEGR